MWVTNINATQSMNVNRKPGDSGSIDFPFTVEVIDIVPKTVETTIMVKKTKFFGLFHTYVPTKVEVDNTQIILLYLRDSNAGGAQHPDGTLFQMPFSEILNWNAKAAEEEARLAEMQALAEKYSNR